MAGARIVYAALIILMAIVLALVSYPAIAGLGQRTQTENRATSISPQFNVTFDQVSGCPNGYSYSIPWGVTLNGQSKSQPPSASFTSFMGSGGGPINRTQLQIIFQVAPGAYNYTIQGDSFSNAPGAVKVNDTDVNVQVTPIGMLCPYI